MWSNYFPKAVPSTEVDGILKNAISIFISHAISGNTNSRTPITDYLKTTYLKRYKSDSPHPIIFESYSSESGWMGAVLSSTDKDIMRVMSVGHFAIKDLDCVFDKYFYNRYALAKVRRFLAFKLLERDVGMNGKGGEDLVDYYRDQAPTVVLSVSIAATPVHIGLSLNDINLLDMECVYRANNHDYVEFSTLNAVNWWMPECERAANRDESIEESIAKCADSIEAVKAASGHVDDDSTLSGLLGATTPIDPEVLKKFDDDCRLKDAADNDTGTEYVDEPLINTTDAPFELSVECITAYVGIGENIYRKMSNIYGDVISPLTIRVPFLEIPQGSILIIPNKDGIEEAFRVIRVELGQRTEGEDSPPEYTVCSLEKIALDSAEVDNLKKALNLRVATEDNFSMPGVEQIVCVGANAPDGSVGASTQTVVDELFEKMTNGDEMTFLFPASLNVLLNTYDLEAMKLYENVRKINPINGEARDLSAYDMIIDEGFRKPRVGQMAAFYQKIVVRCSENPSLLLTLVSDAMTLKSGKLIDPTMRKRFVDILNTLITPPPAA